MKAKPNKVVLFYILSTILLSLSECKKEYDPETDFIMYSGTEGKIGRGGGEIKVNDPNSKLNGTSIKIPTGAIDEVTDIQISLSASSFHLAPQSNNIIVSLKPDGLTFNLPIEIALPYTGSDIKNAQVFYYNPNTLTVEFINPYSYDADNKLVYFRTNHFSEYTCYDNHGILTYNNYYRIQNDINNILVPITPQTQNIFLMTEGWFGWYFDYSLYNKDLTTAPNGYPHILFGKNPCSELGSTTPVLPCELNSIFELTAEFDAEFNYRIYPGGINLVFDIWLTNSTTPTTSNITGEIMIWDHKYDKSFRNPISSLTIDGINYELHKYIHGGFPRCEVFNFIPSVDQANTRNRKIDINKFIKYLKTQGEIETDHKFLSSITFGNEIWYSKGSAIINNYKVDLKSYKSFINNTTWDVSVHFNSTTSWHADVTFYSDGTTKYAT